MVINQTEHQISPKFICFEVLNSNKKGSSVCYNAIEILLCRSRTTIHNLQKKKNFPREFSSIILFGLYIPPQANTSDGAYATVRSNHTTRKQPSKLSYHPGCYHHPIPAVILLVEQAHLSISRTTTALFIEHKSCIFPPETRYTALTKHQFDSINHFFLSINCHVNLYILYIYIKDQMSCFLVHWVRCLVYSTLSAIFASDVTV